MVGNIRSNIYHLLHCPSYRQMAERNKVMFETEADAMEASYRMAGNC